MNRGKVPVLIALAMVMAASACQAALPSPASAPTAPPPALNPVAAGEGASNPATPTRQVPTSAPSMTMTAFPSITPLPPTATETPFGFVASPTPTPIFIATPEPPDPDEGSTTEWGSPYRCSLISKTPSNWTTVKAGSSVKVTWNLMNTGTKTWNANEIVLVYYAGAKLTPPDAKKKYLPHDVKVLQSIDAFVNIYTPKTPGHYRSVWALRVFDTEQTFCTFTIKIFVP